YWLPVPPYSRAETTRPTSPPSAMRRHWRAGKRRDDPALLPARNDRHLVAGNEIPHLVRDRGPRGRRHGRAWHYSKRSRKKNLGKGQSSQVRRLSHRSDRGRGEA